jgi:hypothetical protein
MRALLASLCAAVVLASAGNATAQAGGGPRLRYGGSIVGSLLVLPDQLGGTNDTLFLPGGGFTFHVGVQVNQVLSFVYQNSPTLGFYIGDQPRDPYFVDYNAVLAQLTLANVFDIGAGPSLALLEVPSGLGARFGINSRLAFLIRGFPARPAPRRTAISVGLQSQVTFLPEGVAALTSLGVGTEFY